MNKKELEKAIEEQEKENIRLFKSIPLATKEDPRNKKAEPILKEWREGSYKIKALLKELYKIEDKEHTEKIVKEGVEKKEKTFINGFGEATNKYITSNTYERTRKRNLKEMESFLGYR